MDNPSKVLREALYRARATMAQGSGKCAEWGSAEKHTGALMGFQQIDRLMQEGVEDADRVLIEHEQKNIFHLWYCERCGTYQLPDGDDELGPPECSHGLFFEDPSLGASATEMEKVQVERIS